MSAREKLVVYEANMDAALRSYYRRESAQITTETPFMTLLRREDADAEEADAAVMRERLAAVRAFFVYLTGVGPDPRAVLKRLYTVGRALGIAPFTQLTMHEAAMMFGETKAAQSYRAGVIAGEVKLHGGHGFRMPGQASDAAREASRAAARGNRNAARNKRRRKKETTTTTTTTKKGVTTK